jgi:hypothetical protein
VCCAASGTGSASAANSVMAIKHVNILDFMLPPLCGCQSLGISRPGM